MAKPNILITIADDQRGSALGCQGVEPVQTPCLDALAKRGTCFDRAYHHGSPHGAVCAPSRAMLHTGLPYMQLDNALLGHTYAPQGRTVNVPPTLGGKLRKAGYHCFATGKWHNGVASFHQSFDSGDHLHFSGMADHWFTPVRPFDPTGQYPREAVRTGEGFSTEMFGQSAIDFIRSRKDNDQPFFCYCAFTAPHDPRTPPDEYRRMYDPRTCELPPNFCREPDMDPSILNIRDEVLLGRPRERDVMRRSIAEYYGMITHMDHWIGRIHAALDEIGQLENTIIVHTADHGLAVGQHGLLGKQNVYEHSVRVPLIMAAPGIAADQHRSALCYQHDLHPTLLEMAGAEVGDVHFQSLQPALRDNVGRDFVTSHYERLHRMVRNDRFKLIEYVALERIEFYDLQNDPWEQHNLAADPAYASQIAAMTEQLPDLPVLD